MSEGKALKPDNLPFQQGDLDWLCGLYAIINLLKLQGGISTQEDACKKFEEILCEAAKQKWSILRFVTEGIGKRDANNLLNIAHITNNKIKNFRLEEIPDCVGKSCAFLIYIRVPKTGNLADCFTHYTIINGKYENGYHIFDSFGQKCLIRDKKYFNYGEHIVEIASAWKIPLNTAPSPTHRRNAARRG